MVSVLIKEIDDDMANRGFSLVELMIVAVMLGLLASIASPNFVALQERAKEAGVKCNMHTVQLACEEYAARSVGFYPDDVGEPLFRNLWGRLQSRTIIHSTFRY